MVAQSWWLTEKDMNIGDGKCFRNWEYARIGEYHKNLDPNWSYTPTYLRKMAFIRRHIESHPKSIKILDAACGEGVLVEDFRQKGWNIKGIDLNYESEYVQRGDVCNMPYKSASMDLVLFLDALEHLLFEDQAKALAEMERVLNPNGYFVISVPNLAHLNSRVRFFLRGNLDRADSEKDHPGERPIWEYEQLLRQSGFAIVKRLGITFTFPFVYRRVICKHPKRFRWLHDAMDPLAKLLPSFAMLTIFVCRKANPISFSKVGWLRRLQIIQTSQHPLIFSIYTHTTERERVCLFKLAKHLANKAAIVEIGSYLGASTCFLAAGARARKGKVYAVDTWTNKAMSEGERNTYKDFLLNIGPLKDVIFPLQGKSTEIARQFHKKIDLLFIDGDHSYNGVRKDLDSWLPMVKDGGIVVFHDYGWAEGVQKAVREIVVPLQIEEGRQIDNIYWTRINHRKGNEK